MAKLTKPLKAVIKNGKPTSIDTYGTGDVVPIEHGGTGATNSEDILKNIGAASFNHTHPGMGGGSGGSYNRVYEENPRGKYDKKNTDYRTTYPLVNQTVEVYLNGLKGRAGVDNDFVLIAPNIIRMNEAPYEGDLLTVSYDIYEA